ncbi:hypothetical protein hamaS1_06840 [Moorella sp. Hama-1]|nr:hypothetical protein hamaS1_06840 [Moorella sp. Hama-1]
MVSLDEDYNDITFRKMKPKGIWDKYRVKLDDNSTSLSPHMFVLFL